MSKVKVKDVPLDGEEGFVTRVADLLRKGPEEFSVEDQARLKKFYTKYSELPLIYSLQRIANEFEQALGKEAYYLGAVDWYDRTTSVLKGFRACFINKYEILIVGISGSTNPFKFLKEYQFRVMETRTGLYLRGDPEETGSKATLDVVKNLLESKIRRLKDVEQYDSAVIDVSPQFVTPVRIWTAVSEGGQEKFRQVGRWNYFQKRVPSSDQFQEKYRGLINYADIYEPIDGLETEFNKIFVDLSCRDVKGDTVSVRVAPGALGFVSIQVPFPGDFLKRLNRLAIAGDIEGQEAAILSELRRTRVLVAGRMSRVNELANAQGKKRVYRNFDAYLCLVDTSQVFTPEDEEEEDFSESDYDFSETDFSEEDFEIDTSEVEVDEEFDEALEDEELLEDFETFEDVEVDVSEKEEEDLETSESEVNEEVAIRSMIQDILNENPSTSMQDIARLVNQPVKKVRDLYEDIISSMDREVSVSEDTEMAILELLQEQEKPVSSSFLSNELEVTVEKVNNVIHKLLMDDKVVESHPNKYEVIK